MRSRIWVAGLLAGTAAVLFLGVSRPGHAAAPDVYVGGHFFFSIGATPAFMGHVEGGHVEADVVNPQSPNGVIGRICRVRITFYDAKGSVLQASELKVGPGETGVVRLANLPPVIGDPLPIRATFQVLDTDGTGRMRPCLAIPSVQVVDGKELKTSLLVPVLTS